METNELLENTGTTRTGGQAPVQSIEVSEKAEKLMKKSVRYLTIFLWTVSCFSALAIVGSVIIFFYSMSFDGRFYSMRFYGSSIYGSGIFPTLFMVVFLGVTIIKIYAYLGDYKIFIKHKNQNALDDLLAAQRGFYGWFLLMPLILVGISLLLFIIGGLLR